MKEEVQMRISPKVEGRVTIQLFDEDGTLTHEEVKHNYINPHWLDIVSEWANFATFTAGWVSYTGSPMYNSPFTGLLLTDYEGEINPDDMAIKGATLGWGVQNGSASGSLQGNYNEVESVHQFSYHKFVYDFATNQANGTFSSVYTAPIQPSGSQLLISNEGVPAPGVMTGAGSGLGSQGATSTLVLRYGEYAYLVSMGGGYVRRLPIVDILNQTASASSLEEFPLPIQATSVRGATIYNDRLYWMENAVSSSGPPPTRTQRVFSAPMSNLMDRRNEAVFDVASGTQHSGLTYSPLRDQFFIGDDSTSRLAAVDPEDFTGGSMLPFVGTVYSITGSTGNAGDYFKLVASEVDRDMFLMGGAAPSSQTHGWYVSLDDDAGVARSRGIRGVLPLGYIGKLIAGWSTTGLSTIIRLGNPAAFFSRVLLDEPVSKTSINTMKIAYEFTFPEPTLW